MAYNYGSNAALQALVTKVEELLGGKVSVEAGKGLSTNDLTNELKAQYDEAYTFSQAAHAPTDAEKNVIVGITFNGAEVTVDPDSRVAAITATIPTAVSELTNDSNFQTDAQVSTAITTALADYYTKTEADAAIATAVAGAQHLKYAIVDALPTDDIDTTTIYMVTKAGATGQDVYTEYMYLNGQWEIIGDTAVDLSDYYTKEQADAAITAALANYVLATDMVEITSDEVLAMFTA